MMAGHLPQAGLPVLRGKPPLHSLLHSPRIASPSRYVIFVRVFPTVFCRALSEPRHIMRIAVISDTHDECPRRLAAKLRGADEIWHLGDVMDTRILADFEKLGVPLKVILGNCDHHLEWPESLSLDREGVLCHLVHIPPRKAPGGIQLLLHGHTHIPRDYTDALGVRWLNPGSPSCPRGGFPPSFAWLEIVKGQVLGWTLVRV